VLTLVSIDLLSTTGRSQAFGLGESFAEHYSFTLLNKSHVYEVEFAGFTISVGG